MLTVEDYGQVRRAHRDGMSIREIARTFHHSRRKVREALARPEPEPYTRAKDPPAPKLGAFHATIKAILAADEQAPRKQRHAEAIDSCAMRTTVTSTFAASGRGSGLWPVCVAS